MVHCCHLLQLLIPSVVTIFGDFFYVFHYFITALSLFFSFFFLDWEENSDTIEMWKHRLKFKVCRKKKKLSNIEQHVSFDFSVCYDNREWMLLVHVCRIFTEISRHRFLLWHLVWLWQETGRRSVTNTMHITLCRNLNASYDMLLHFRSTYFSHSLTRCEFSLFHRMYSFNLHGNGS